MFSLLTVIVILKGITFFKKSSFFESSSITFYDKRIAFRNDSASFREIYGNKQI